VAIALVLCLNKLIDTATACVAIALALCFTVVESDSGNFVYHNTLQNLMTVLMLSDPPMISKFIFARFDVP
jgi:hypothetical protein